MGLAVECFAITRNIRVRFLVWPIIFLFSIFFLYRIGENITIILFSFDYNGLYIGLILLFPVSILNMF